MKLFIIILIFVSVVSLGIFMAHHDYCVKLSKEQQEKRKEYSKAMLDNCVKTSPNYLYCVEGNMRSNNYMERFDREVLKYEGCIDY